MPQPQPRQRQAPRMARETTKTKPQKKARAARMAPKNPATRAQAKKDPKDGPDAAKVKKTRTARRPKNKKDKGRRQGRRKPERIAPGTRPPHPQGKRRPRKRPAHPRPPRIPRCRKRLVTLMNTWNPLHPHRSPPRCCWLLCARARGQTIQPPVHQLPRPRRTGACWKSPSSAPQTAGHPGGPAQGQERRHPALRPRPADATGCPARTLEYCLRLHRLQLRNREIRHSRRSR